MSKKKNETKKVHQPKAKTHHLADYIENTISNLDEMAALQRKEQVQKKNPNATPEELVDMLIKQKCLQTGTIGAVTSGASVIPGIGTVASLTFGTAVDMGMSFKLQAELVLEIAAAYQHQLGTMEKRNAVLLITGIGVGTSAVMNKIGQRVAQEATEQLVQKALAKAIPFIGITSSAGVNMLTTYVIGKRAQAYFSLTPDEMGEWDESVRALTGLDERKLVDWLSEAVEYAWKLASGSFGNVAGVVIGAGRLAGEIVISGAGHVGGAVMGVVRGTFQTAKKVGDSIGSGASSVGKAVVGAGRGVTGALVRKKHDATELPAPDAEDNAREQKKS